MEIKILQVFYGKDGLPYKDKDRTVHFPIVGTGFLGASNTTKIKFYYEELDNLDETTWVAVSKLPNGKIGSKVLETDYDSTLGEHYALLELDSFYFQYKGDVYISLQGYQGGVQVSYDEETELYTIYGTPTIAATGSIKLSVNYATQFVGSGETSNVNFQRILADLGTKLGIRAQSEHVEELPTVGQNDIFYVVNDDPNNQNLQNIYIWNENTQSYVWVGDNTLYLGEYYTKEQGNQFEEGIDNRVSSVENELSSVAQGSPKGAYATLSDLQTAYPTGAEGIYVVQADGHWYYWNGSVWTDGGVYLSGPFDAELSKTSTNAPQNKAVSLGINKSYDEALNRYTKPQYNLFDYTKLYDGYIDDEDVLHPSASYQTTEYIPVIAGKYLVCSQNDANEVMTSKNMRFYNFYDELKNLISSGALQSSVLVPTGAYFARVSIAAVNENDKVQLELTDDGNISVYHPFRNLIAIYNKNKMPYGYENIENCATGRPSKKVRADTFENGDSLTIDSGCIHRGNVIIFFGKLTSTFNYIEIGTQGYGYTECIRVYADHWQDVYRGTPGANVSHGLTLKDYLFVSIYIDETKLMHLTILTNGGEYHRDVTQWDGSSYQIFAYSYQSTLTDCSLSYANKYFNCPIYYFGDSYTSYSDKRFPYWLNKWGYKNYLLDGYPGESSFNGLGDLYKILKFGIPKFIVWAHGMNDGDTNNTINAVWKNKLDYVIGICQTYGIELILCTIPNTPEVTNYYKNQYIKSSGYRYIDFADAVGANEINSTWYDGMLSNDNVHPTAEGAMALAKQIIVDFPEITYN